MIIDDLRRQDEILTYLYKAIPESKDIAEIVKVFPEKGIAYIDRQVTILQAKGLVNVVRDYDFNSNLVSVTGKGCERAEEVLVKQYRDAKQRGL